MNQLSVKLWGEELGRLVWDDKRRLSYFQFTPNRMHRPDVSPLLCPIGSLTKDLLPVYGNSDRLYQGLPPFIADSLPDAWGNKLFDQWVKQSNIRPASITPLHKLMFIGKRGMGALEFEPTAQELEHRMRLDLQSLYGLSMEIAAERDAKVIRPEQELTLQTLLAAGTSAGGRQMKAVIAINPQTREIRSGQTAGLDGFDYCIMKFKDELVPTSEIEMAYHDMAVAGGIEMTPCQIMTVGNVKHFVTRRFDRVDGKKIHMQTLAAINPEADSYESLMATCRSINLTESEITEVFRRLTFNVMANNTDDHNKNFSFLLSEGGRWKLAPAYDMTFIFNINGTGPERHRCMSLYGKTENITREDLLEFARDNSIRGAEAIISKVAEAIGRFPELSVKYAIPAPWSQIIASSLRDNLASFGYTQPATVSHRAAVGTGRRFENISISINSKGHYDVRATVDGTPRRRFIRPGSELYAAMQSIDLQKTDAAEFARILSVLFMSEP